MKRSLACAILVGLMLASGGCASTEHYDVIVTNRLDETVTVWLTRVSGPDYEAGWVPPEVMALGTTGSAPEGGVVLHAGVSTEAKVKGTEDQGNPAVLRVYRSTNMNTILAMSRGNPGRVDYILDPGRSDLDVTLVDGELQVVPHAAAKPTQ